MWRFCFLCIFLVLIGVNPLKAVESIGFYYNKIDSARELINYDRVVVNPDFLSDRQLSVLHKAESKVYAYLSMGEFDLAAFSVQSKKLNAKLLSIPHSINPIWQTRAIDQSNNVWKNYLIEQAQKFAERGFDGVFLDTVDSYQLLDKKQFSTNVQESALIDNIKSISQIKNSKKQLSIIINRGFEVLDRLILNDVTLEAVVAESLYQKYNPQKKHYYSAKKEDTLWLNNQLQKIKEKGIEVIVIDYASSWDKNIQRQLAKNILQLGYTPYVSDGLLNTLGTSTIEPVGKRVLGFYDGSLVNDVTYSKCHRLLAMPLEYLGYVPECVDINKFQTDTIDMTRYAGILFWVDAEAFSKNKAINEWIFNIIGRKKVLFLGALPQNQKILNKLGVSQQYDLSGKVKVSKGLSFFRSNNSEKLSSKTLKTDIVAPQLSPFEVYAAWQLVGKDSQVFVGIQDDDLKKSALIFNSNWGGAALTPMPVTTLSNNQSKWLVDPFWLLENTLKLDAIPSADVTTESGSRIFTTHIDGDGFPSRSGFTKQPFVSKIILDNILVKRKNPHTVSVIEGEISIDGLYPELSAELEVIAKDMFKLEHIEAATHTFSHPFYWSNRNVDRKQPYGNYLPIKNYQLDYKKEIVGSSHYLKTLLPENKNVRLILWSGDADPSEQQIEIAESEGLLNVNGGNTYSVNGDSDLTMVSPVLSWYKNAVQVYAPIQNENLHTNLWRENFGGFSRVIETFQNLESPKRLKPISLYYHMYSGTYPASLQSLNKVYDWIDTQTKTPLYLSEYAIRAQSLYETGLAKGLFGGWNIVSTGIRSIRLPLTLGVPDMKNSDVIGWNEEEDGNYLILNETRSSLSLQTNRSLKVIQQRLVKANAQILTWEKIGEVVNWKVQSHTPFRMTLKNYQKCNIESSAELNVHNYGRLTLISSDASGEIAGVINCN